MNAEYFFDLYKRNVAGFWKAGFIDDTYSLFVSIPHVILSPLTLTLGAGIKTLFDCFSRTYTPEPELKPIPGLIDKMDNNQIEQLRVVLTKQQYSPKSNSSKLMFNSLSSDAQRTRAIRERSAAVGQKMQKLFLDENPRMKGMKLPTVQELQKYRFNNYHHKELCELQSEPIAAGCDESKKLLKEYMKAEKNNGKKLFQIVMGFFKQSSSTPANSERVVAQAKP